MTDTRCFTGREELRQSAIEAICPHIKRWSDDGDGHPEPCRACPREVVTSEGVGVQMCRLNAEKAADAVLGILSNAQKPNVPDLERFCIAFTWAYGTAMEKKHYDGREPEDGHTPESLWAQSDEEDREFMRGVLRDTFSALAQALPAGDKVGAASAARRKLPPGPWQIEPHQDNPYNCHVVDSAGQNIIVNVGRAFAEWVVEAATPQPASNAEGERPPCPRCSFPYELGAAERYWESRWRDEKAENDRLRGIAYPSWQPIKTAPKNGTRILGFSGNGSKVVAEIFYMQKQSHGATGTHSHPGGWIGPNGHLFDATDWQPLPVGPTVLSTQRGGGGQ